VPYVFKARFCDYTTIYAYLFHSHLQAKAFYAFKKSFMRAAHSTHLNILGLVTPIMSVEYTSCKVLHFVILPFIVTSSPLFTTLYLPPRSETSQILKRLAFDPRSVQVGFVVDKMVPGQVFVPRTSIMPCH
jgi:hypothetical protein